MACHRYFFCIFATIAFTNAVKVNMQGSLNLGKEVMDTLTHYLRSGYSISGRRSMTPNIDPIAIEVKSAVLCRKINVCKGPLRKFVNEYVTSLARAIAGVFDEIFNAEVLENLEMATPIFGKLKGSLREVKKILKVADSKATDKNEAYSWVGVIKKISGTFLGKSVTYIIDRLDNNIKDIAEVKKRLTQKIVISIIATEAKYQKRLCYDYEVCLHSVECTKALHSVLTQLTTVSNIKTKAFMKAFFELLPETNINSRLNEVTNNAFQVILNDMAFSDNVPTREVFRSVQKTVEARLNSLYTKSNGTAQSQDVILVHSILSDMDLFYSRGKPDPFHVFLNDFVEWTISGGQVTTCLKFVIKNLRDMLSGISEELSTKLTYEVRVFLEITVDPDTNYNNII